MLTQIHAAIWRHWATMSFKCTILLHITDTEWLLWWLPGCHWWRWRRLQWQGQSTWQHFRFCENIQYTQRIHYSNVIMSATASQITFLAIVYSTVYSGVDQRKHRSSTSPAFVRGIHRWPVNSPHNRPVTPKMFPFDDVIMYARLCFAVLFMRLRINY